MYMKYVEYEKEMSVSTTSHVISPSAGSHARAMATTLTANGRTVSVHELMNPHTGEFRAYEVLVVKVNHEREVKYSGIFIGLALQEHFRLVTKYGGVAKPKPAKQVESEKVAALDKIIEELDSPSVKFGRSLGDIEAKKRKAIKKPDDEDLSWRSRGLASNIQPRKCQHDFLQLNYKTSAVDAMKAMGWDSGVAGRQSVAMSLGFRGKLSNDDRDEMNAWLVREINRRFRYELMDREKKAIARASDPVFTPLDWDAHMMEIAKNKVANKYVDTMQEIVKSKMVEIPKRVSHPPALKGHPDLQDNVASIAQQINKEVKEGKLTRRTKKNKILALAVQHLYDTDHEAIESYSRDELPSEIEDFFDEYVDGDWHNTDVDELLEMITDYYEG